MLVGFETAFNYDIISRQPCNPHIALLVNVQLDALSDVVSDFGRLLVPRGIFEGAKPQSCDEVMERNAKMSKGKKEGKRKKMLKMLGHFRVHGATNIV